MYKFLIAAFAATLLSTTAFAEDRQIEVELPKTITITCSDSVRPGTVVLTNPPKFSCSDYDVVKRVIGTGITVGPDTRISRIMRAVRRVEKPRRPLSVAEVRQNERNTRLVNRSKSEIVNGWRDVRMPNLGPNRGYERGAWQPLDDFDKRFPGIHRNRAWFEKTDGRNERNFLTEGPSTEVNCTGYVNLSDLLSGKCKDVKVRVN
ncbi:uncharacterized protein METZ01_LOCUS128330 [marine metagenome]|uniref:Uncharacterized protein n=1 Tax=marine metagenome TaxID=408172 RepID=A0A381YEE7_9ZZZZ